MNINTILEMNMNSILEHLKSSPTKAEQSNTDPLHCDKHAIQDEIARYQEAISGCKKQIQLLNLAIGRAQQKINVLTRRLEKLESRPQPEYLATIMIDELTPSIIDKLMNIDPDIKFELCPVISMSADGRPKVAGKAFLTHRSTRHWWHKYCRAMGWEDEE